MPHNQLDTVWLPEAAYGEMIAEANVRSPLETGGVLLGYRSSNGCDAVVTTVIGPGPKAKHSSHRFVPDYEFQEAEIARLYHRSPHELFYLGDWHTHPGGAAEMSARDKKALKRISTHTDARVPEPIMVILAGGPTWKNSAWCGSHARGRCCLRTFVLDEIIVRFYSGRSIGSKNE